MKGSEDAGTMSSVDAVIVLTSVGADFDAASLARTLVEERLAACVSIVGGVRSIYRWEDRVTSDQEQLLLIKTTRARLEELRGQLLKRHPYAVPELLVLDTDEVGDAYGQWLSASVSRA